VKFGEVGRGFLQEGGFCRKGLQEGFAGGGTRGQEEQGREEGADKILTM
jgi:hypothetical protein